MEKSNYQTKKNSSQKILVELTVKEDSDPQLEFLKQKASNYPRLLILAKKYLCLMASRTPLDETRNNISRLANPLKVYSVAFL